MDLRKTASAAGAASAVSAAAAPARWPAPPSIAPTEASAVPHIHRRRVTAWLQQSMGRPPQDARDIDPRFRTDRLGDFSRPQGSTLGRPAWQRRRPNDVARPLPLWPPD